MEVAPATAVLPTPTTAPGKRGMEEEEEEATAAAAEADGITIIVNLRNCLSILLNSLCNYSLSPSSSLVQRN